MSWHELSTVGMLPTISVGLAAWVHGAARFGTQGMGAPSAAATVGFDMDVHMTKGGTFMMGLLSMMFATGGAGAMTLFAGSTTLLDGAMPKVQSIMPPMHISTPTTRLLRGRARPAREAARGARSRAAATSGRAAP